MALSITSLNSGSNGNCYYIGNEQEAILVDTGLSCRETEKRMQLLGLSMKKLKAIFISHEHTDHIKGLCSISEKYQLPVFITDNTLRHTGLAFTPGITKHFRAFEPIQVGQLTVTAFPKLHDAEDPHSFIVTGNGVTIGVFTDIGRACANLTKYFSLCDAAFLEANYDEALLENGRYPYFLKHRIRGGNGHLSNKEALDIFIQYRPPFMTHLLLSHLSKDNNCPEIAGKLFREHAGHTKIIIASRDVQTPVYFIQRLQVPQAEMTKRKTAFKILQLSLFDQ